MAGSRRILVLGATGQVGRALPSALEQLGEVIALDRAGADLSDPASLPGVIDAHRPDAIINAAAYTAVDRAESEEVLAMTVNGESPKVIAEAAAARGIPLVHYSTDYVFDGSNAGAYREVDPVAPIGAYGRSKLAGETGVRAVGARHLIFRTSWVYAVAGTNFVRTMLRIAGKQERLRVVADQVGAPTGAALIADVTASVLTTMLGAPANDPRWGVYHLVAAGETSWHGYAQYLIGRARELGFPLVAAPDGVEAIATAEYPTPARRPTNSRLDTSHLRTTFGIDLPDWRRGVDEVLETLRTEAVA